MLNLRRLFGASTPYDMINWQTQGSNIPVFCAQKTNFFQNAWQNYKKQLSLILPLKKVATEKNLNKEKLSKLLAKLASLMVKLLGRFFESSNIKNPLGVWRNGRRYGLKKLSLDREIFQVAALKLRET